MIEILSSGALNQVQDLGRSGHMQQGISRGGAMDGPALAIANLLVGNSVAVAGLEIGQFPFRIRFRQASRFACTGADSTVRLDGRVLPPWWSSLAKTGQTLVIEPPEHGVRSYLTFAGGVDVPLLLGSAATDNKGGFGGFQGRGLRRGDMLPIAPPTPAVVREGEYGCAPSRVAALWHRQPGDCIEVRAIPAAEYPLFTVRSRAAFCEQEWIVTPEANRTGYRLQGAEGELLELIRPVELLSHGILPGTVQVPPAGNPIVQMAEANTCGGYPKIAAVVATDLWKLAQAPSGARVKFSLITMDDAIADAKAATQWLAQLQSDLSVHRR